MTEAQNPYLPPSGSDGAAPPEIPFDPKSPPTSIPKVLGILSIIFAGVTIASSIMSSCMGFLGGGLSSWAQKVPMKTKQGQQTGPQAAPEADKTQPSSAKDPAKVREMLEHVGTFYTAFGLQGVVFLVMSLFLLVVGIGQARYRRWARGQTMVWSTAALLVLAGVVVMNFMVIGPAYERMLEVMTKSIPSGAMPVELSSKLSSMIGGSMGVGTLLMYAPYPIVMMIYFRRDSVKAAMIR
jgi:hypothetical protein